MNMSAVLVQSDVPRKKEDRVKRSWSVGAETARSVEEYTERTGVPQGRLIDFAVAAYLKEESKPSPLTKSLQDDQEWKSRPPALSGYETQEER